MEAGQYGLTRRTCFVARRLELVAVAGLLWISWCVLRAARFRVFFSIFFASNAHGLLQVLGRFASFTSLLVMRQDRESEATEDIFCLWVKKSLHTGVRTGYHFLISLSVCLSVVCLSVCLSVYV